MDIISKSKEVSEGLTSNDQKADREIYSTVNIKHF